MIVFHGNIVDFRAAWIVKMAGYKIIPQALSLADSGTKLDNKSKAFSNQVSSLVPWLNYEQS